MMRHDEIPWGQSVQPAKETSSECRAVTLTPASQIKIKPVRWLWDERLALGTLGLLGGREGIGNRTTYHDFGLVFAKEWGELRARKDLMGQPLQKNNLGERSFDRLTKAAKVRRIKFHGLRHTCATLLLRAGVPVHVVSERLGHSDVQITLNTYAHVLPDMQQGAADPLGAILHRGTGALG